MAVLVVVDKAALNDALAELRSYQGPEMQKRLKVATRAGATSLKAPVKAAAPRKTGRLADSTKVVQVKDAGKWIGYRVQVGGKGARQANIIVGGSKPHRIRGKVGEPLGLPFGPRAVVHHPGTKPNPYVQRVGEREDERVFAAMAKSIARQRSKAGF